MADTRISIILDAKDNASRKLQGVADNIEQSLDRVGIAAGIAAAAITAFAYKSVRAFLDAENATIRLRKITQNSVDATEDQVQALLAQASALEKVGVVSADAVVQMQGTLATFDLQTDSISKLTPALLDMVVAEKGVNATQDDMAGYANALGGALMGNFGALTQRGFALDEDTKAMIANGTEQERITALVSVLNSTYAGFNETMRNTTEGGIKGAKIAMDNLVQTIGGALIPAIQAITPPITKAIQAISEWVEAHPKLTAQIIAFSLAITGFVAALAAAGPVIGVVSQAIALLGTPIGYVILAVAVVSAAIIFFREKIGELYQLLQQWGIVDAFRDAFARLWDVIKNQLWPAIQDLFKALEPFLPLLKSLAILFGTLLVAALLILIGVLTLVVQIVAALIEAFAKVVAFVTEKLAPVINWVSGIVDGFSGAIRGTISVIDDAIAALSRFIAKAKEAASLGIGGVVGKVSSAIGNAISGKKAYGGPVAGGMPYLAGENGPEIFVPNANGRIIPNGALAGAGGGGMTINVSGNSFGANMDARDVAVAIGDELVRALKLNARV